VGADKLILLSHSIKHKYRNLAEQKGKAQGGYSRFIDLRKTPEALPALLYCGGIHNGVNKLQFLDVEQLGLSHVREIAARIFGHSRSIRISRIDWCIDVLGTSILDLGPYCRLAGVHNCSIERSRSGVTFYLRRSRQHVLLIYDRLARLRAIRHPLAEYFSSADRMTRLEVQLKGRGLPFRRFEDIERYAELDLLSGLSVWQFGPKPPGLTTTAALAADGLRHKIDQYGLQVTSKMYPSQFWSYLQKKLLIPAPESSFPDLQRLMRNSIHDWLKDRIRFPRLAENVNP
jgi:hypothetical protein